MKNTCMASRAVEKKHLEAFDDLDYNVFSGQKWEQLGKSHDKDIVVHWPDGHTTKGIDVHIEDLKAMFVYAPKISYYLEDSIYMSSI
jgi:hypothetical protein